MKKLIAFFLLFAVSGVLILNSISAQAPEKISYQAVIRNSNNKLVASQGVGMQITILKGTDLVPVYAETHTVSTNENGLLIIEIGTGSVVYGTLATIDWSADIYSIKTETDPTSAGGTNYTITGTSQLLSVPYALHAKSAKSLTPLAVGQYYQGGIIFWLDETGQHGLIASTSDQSTDIQWYNGSFAITNAVRDGIYAGKYNTVNITALQSSGSYAARICAEYQGGGYGDWYLPSKYELTLLYQQKDVVGGFANEWYWSSTENTATFAWCQNFDSGSQYFNKSFLYNVRAIRAF